MVGKTIKAFELTSHTLSLHMIHLDESGHKRSPVRKFMSWLGFSGRIASHCGIRALYSSLGNLTGRLFEHVFGVHP
jgi:hypothetical protein